MCYIILKITDLFFVGCSLFQFETKLRSQCKEPFLVELAGFLDENYDENVSAGGIESKRNERENE